MKRLLYLCVVSCLIMAPYKVLASDYDGNKPLLCAVIDAMECTVSEGCQKTTVDIMGIPQFVNIDFKNNKISAAGANADPRSAAIKNSQRQEGKLIMQGTSENGRGWSVIIAEDTGKMSAAVTDDQIGFILFGACTTIQ